MNQKKVYQIHRQYFDKRSGRFHEVRIDEDSAKYLDRAPMPFLGLSKRRWSIVDDGPRDINRFAREESEYFREWMDHVRLFMRVVFKAYGVKAAGRYCWVSDRIPADLALAQNLHDIFPATENDPVSLVCFVAAINRQLLPVFLAPLYKTQDHQRDFAELQGKAQTDARKLKWDDWQIEADNIQKARATSGQALLTSKMELARLIKKRLKLSDSAETIRKRIHP